jgi:hypothetical protein
MLTPLEALDFVRKALLVLLSLLELLHLDLLAVFLELSLLARRLGLLDRLPARELVRTGISRDCCTYDSSTSFVRILSMWSSDLTISA